MNLSEQFKALNDFDLADLDMENIGSWPLVLKGIVLALLYVVILVAGFYLHVDDLKVQLKGAEQEVKVRKPMSHTCSVYSVNHADSITVD